MRFYMEKVEANRNFANKIWNASRFILMNMPEEAPGVPAQEDLQPADRWIISKANTLVKDVTENMERYELGVAVQKIYDFIWDEFCDWYIEMVKPRLYADESAAASKNAALYTLRTVLIDALKLLHPYMPFITEEIFCNLQDAEESIMVSDWPVYSEDRAYPAEEAEIETLKEAIRGIRNVRTGMNVPPSKKAMIYVVSESGEKRSIFERNADFFKTLAFGADMKVQADKSGIAEDAVSVVIAHVNLYIPLSELVDLEKERERLAKEEQRLKGEIARAQGMLSNEKFVSKAPEKKIAEEKEKLEKYTKMLDQVQEQLRHLQK